ncbi:hypothetical protein [Mucilaginibacter antarcticus]|uniref:hypothetical protein n=1 Tax=Mucilaginibacter antarcticus TaxID=1855725 RepID=UPI00363A6A33
MHPTIIKTYEDGKLFNYINVLDEDKEEQAAELRLAEKVLLEILDKEKLAEAS